MGKNARAPRRGALLIYPGAAVYLSLELFSEDFFMAEAHSDNPGIPISGAARALLLDVGNNKTAFAFCHNLARPETAVRRDFPTDALNAAAVKEFLRPETLLSGEGGYSVPAAADAGLANAIAAANARGAGRASAADIPAAEDTARAEKTFSGKVKTLSAMSPAPVFVSSVVPALDAPLRGWLEAEGWTDITFINPAVHQIIPHCLPHPETAGSDHLLASRAAFSLRAVNPQREPVLLIQAGSAAVLDLIDKDGVLRGGMIMPGPKMWLGALGTAAKLPVLDPLALDWSARAPGTDTETAILNGAVAGLVGEIREGVRRLLMSLHRQVPLLVFSGGWGQHLLEFFPGNYYPDLVLWGLADFAREYSAKLQKG